MAMEGSPTSPQLSTYGTQNNVAVAHTVPSTHNAVNIIQPDQTAKGLFIVDPSQQHTLQMYANTERPSFMASNSVEYNTTPAITVPSSNGNSQIMVSYTLYRT